MGPKDYEAFVARVLSCFACFQSAKLNRNRRFKGVRQPGIYEVDISLEITLGDVASILVIVECKNWRRPVDRSVIQRLVQTRDAIAAHKAAVVSPTGFTAQAVEVARAHGVALWFVTETSFHVVVFAGGTGTRPCPSDLKAAFVTSRQLMFRYLKVAPDFDAAYDLMELPQTISDKIHRQDIDAGDPLQTVVAQPGSALGQIANAVFNELASQESNSRGQSPTLFDEWMETVMAELRRCQLHPKKMNSAVQAIISCDYEKFTQAFETKT